MSAYACEPGKGSEPGVGWNFATGAAKHHQVWVLTRANNRTAIETELEKKNIPNLHFIYHDLPIWARWWKRGGRGVQLYYYLWQMSAYFPAKALQQKIGFDLAHHVTFVKYWTPSFLALLDIPYIWGPVGGGEAAPFSFWKTFGIQGFFFELLRIIAQRFGETDPLVRKTAKRATIALAATKETKQRLDKLQTRQTLLMSQVGMSSDALDVLARFTLKTDVSICFIGMGNLLAWKGVHLGLKAFAAANISDAQYWLIGSGPERRKLEKLTQKLNIQDRVHFLGQLPRQDALKTLAKGSILVHPSLHDSGGWVIQEAMALGKPVICLDLGGPALQVTAETGIKVSAITPQQTIQDLAKAMRKLAHDNELCRKMGQAGKLRTHQIHAWENKLETLNYLYQKSIQERN